LRTGLAPGDPDAGQGIRVALIDSGVDPAHPLLAGRVAGHASFGRRGERDWGAEPVDASGHGSHTAGIVAQQAPGAALLPARAVEGGAVIWRILAAIDWAIRERADIVAMPVGVPGRNPVLWPAITALRARTILPVAAIGNTGAGVALAPGWYLHVLAVGAAGSDGLPLKFSGSVNEAGDCLKPDLLAPGAGVVSAAPGGGMVARSGTSMAAAMVAGTVAMLMQRHGASAEAVEDALLRTAVPVAPGREHRVRCGVLAAAAAERWLGSREADLTEPGLPSPAAPAAYCHPRLGELLAHADPESTLELVLATPLRPIEAVVAELQRDLPGAIRHHTCLPELKAARLLATPELVAAIMTRNAGILLSPADIVTG
jgi:subtilisin family serine protease